MLTVVSILTLVPVSYLSAPSAVHSYRVPGKFIRRLKNLFVRRLAILPVSKARTHKFYIYRQCTYIVYIFNIRDTEFDICITLVLLKRADGPNHYLNIKYDIIVEPLSTLNQIKMVGKLNSV
jgi:hypothetical protein